MANIAKYNSSATGHMFKHYERGKELNEETGEWEYVKFHNQEIDPSRSHLNYNLAPARYDKTDGHELTQLEILHQRLFDEDVYYRKRKDTNVMCSCVLTKPKGLPAEESERFFKTAYKALCSRYSEENVISAYVHRDESGEDHIHFAFVPVVYDEKKKRYTVSAKMLIDKKDLQTLHPYLTEELEKEFGYDVGIENGVTKEGNLTVAQLKAQTARAEQLEKENNKLQEENEKLQASCSQYQQTAQFYKSLADNEEKRADSEHERVKQLAAQAQANQKLIEEQSSILNELAELTPIKSDEEYEQVKRELACDMEALEDFVDITWNNYFDVQEGKNDTAVIDDFCFDINEWCENNQINKPKQLFERIKTTITNLGIYERLKRIKERVSDSFEERLQAIKERFNTVSRQYDDDIELEL